VRKKIKWFIIHNIDPVLGTFPNDFPWYFEALKRIEVEDREEKERRLNRRPTGTKIRVVGAKNLNTKIRTKVEL
jgi:hypothetical protein